MTFPEHFLTLGLQCPVCLTFYRLVPAVVSDPEAESGLAMGLQVVKPEVGGCDHCRGSAAQTISMRGWFWEQPKRKPKPKRKKR